MVKIKIKPRPEGRFIDWKEEEDIEIVSLQEPKPQTLQYLDLYYETGDEEYLEKSIEAI